MLRGLRSYAYWGKIKEGLLAGYPDGKNNIGSV